MTYICVWWDVKPCSVNSNHSLTMVGRMVDVKPGMLTILVNTIVNTNNSTLAKSIADINTNTAFENYCQYQYFCDHTFYYFYIQQSSFFPSINKVNKMIFVEKMAKSL